MMKVMNIFAVSCVLALSLSACQSKKAEEPAPARALVAGALAAYTPGQKAHCPVTGEEFVVAANTVQAEHEGKHFAFCCADCQPTFAKNPAKFAAK